VIDVPGDDDLGTEEEAMPAGEGADLVELVNEGVIIGPPNQRYTIPAMWVGGGTDAEGKLSGTLAPSESAMTPISAGDFGNIVFNDRIAHNLIGNPVTVLMLTDIAKKASPDWRTLGLKAALLDSTREVATTDPTGVSWAQVTTRNTSFSVSIPIK